MSDEEIALLRLALTQGSPCRCLCLFTHPHIGELCIGVAQTTLAFSSPLAVALGRGPSVTPICHPCAYASDCWPSPARLRVNS